MSTEKIVQDNSNIDPNAWGPNMWYIIHIIAVSYPQQPTFQDRKTFQDFYERLVYILPCHKCRMNYSRHLREIPIIPYMDNRNKLVEWSILLHNRVNKELGKPELTITDAQNEIRRNIQRNLHMRHTSKLNFDPLWIPIIVLLGINGYFLWKYVFHVNN